MKLLILTFLTFFCTSIFGQNSENKKIIQKTLSNKTLTKNNKMENKKNAEWQGVHDALMDYIEAFYEGDSAKIIRSISPTVSKYGFMKNDKTNEYEGRAMPFEDMITWVNTKSKVYNKKFSDIEKVEIYEIQDITASGKVTAWWGTDYVLLEKVGEKWFLKMILWEGPLKK
jgi:lipopolysaccharide export LptBFGC system permease protein LptF